MKYQGHVRGDSVWLWEGESDRRSDDKLAPDVRKLRSWFKEIYRRDPRLAWGYGRAWTSFATPPYPLVLLNSYRTRFDFWTESSEPVAVEQALSQEDRDFFNFPQTAHPLFVLFVRKPEPSTTVKERLKALLPTDKALLCPTTERSGSAGVAVSLSDGSAGVLTAGHVLPLGAGSDVNLVSGWRFLRKSTPFGKVEHHSVPIATVGWDAAVIRPNSKPRFLKKAVTRWPSVRYGQELTYARGAKSGVVERAVLIAGLEEVQAAPLGWHCCWLIGPTDALVAGDSGASVFVRQTDELLGTYVGASRLGYGIPYALYVQDAYSLQANLFSNWNVSF
jgi:hypothetical protein